MPPLLLAAPEGSAVGWVGIQVHAVRSPQPPRPILLADTPCGRVLEAGGYEYVALTGLADADAGDKPAQGRAVFEKAEAALRTRGADMHNVVRTWFWLGDILSWYGAFNQVRNRFFTERGLLNGDPGRSRLPASTGIGVRPAGAPECALDVIALVGGGRAEFFHDAGRQKSPFHYGSAFSRGARVTTPAGTTVYVSGTAAIDMAGHTVYTGDAEAQVAVTIENVRAVLKDAGCSDADVVQAIAYSKTPAVQAVFHRDWAGLGWPCVSVLGDVCRDDLLFEVEATACPRSRRL